MKTVVVPLPLYILFSVRQALLHADERQWSESAPVAARPAGVARLRLAR
ncbi:MAG: hypothetical protein ACK4RK_19475 [Gemmataceae bacterium]